MAEYAGSEEDDHLGDWNDCIDPDAAIIIDNGTGMCKAGLSIDKVPSLVMPEAVGRPRPQHRGSLDQDVYFGDELPSRLGQLSVKYPLQNGIIDNMNDMEDLWEYIFCRLNADPSLHPVALTEPPFNPKAERMKMAEIMFEHFHVPELNISIQGVLALYAAGRLTGLVLDSGEGVTHTIPVCDGFACHSSITRSDIAGRELNTLLAKLLAGEGVLADMGVSLTSTSAQAMIRDIKEKLCYVAMDPIKEVVQPKKYTLPDGRELSLGDELWKTPEALFNPALCGFEEASSPGVANMIRESVRQSSIDNRTALVKSIVLSGGSTMFPGFAERLEHELRAPNVFKDCQVVVKDEPHNLAVWQGAQTLASLRYLDSGSEQWVSCEEWFECGYEHLHSKLAVRCK